MDATNSISTPKISITWSRRGHTKNSKWAENHWEYYATYRGLELLIEPTRNGDHSWQVANAEYVLARGETGGPSTCKKMVCDFLAALTEMAYLNLPQNRRDLISLEEALAYPDNGIYELKRVSGPTLTPFEWLVILMISRRRDYRFYGDQERRLVRRMVVKGWLISLGEERYDLTAEGKVVFARTMQRTRKIRLDKGETNEIDGS